MAEFLPNSGDKSHNTPIWDEGRHMFITNQHVSMSKHLYYLGIRVSDRVIIKEHICKSLNLDFINAIEVYSYNGTGLVLIGKKEYECCIYNEESIRRDAEVLLYDYSKGKLETQHKNLDDKFFSRLAKETIAPCYSFEPNADLLSKLGMLSPSEKDPK